MTKLNIDKTRALFLRFRTIHEKDFPSARTVVVSFTSKTLIEEDISSENVLFGRPWLVYVRNVINFHCKCRKVICKLISGLAFGEIYLTSTMKESNRRSILDEKRFNSRQKNVCSRQKDHKLLHYYVVW